MHSADSYRAIAAELRARALATVNDTAAYLGRLAQCYPRLAEHADRRPLRGKTITEPDWRPLSFPITPGSAPHSTEGRAGSGRTVFHQCRTNGLSMGQLVRIPAPHLTPERGGRQWGAAGLTYVRLNEWWENQPRSG
jgi:hypothetical protein